MSRVVATRAAVAVLLLGVLACQGDGSASVASPTPVVHPGPRDGHDLVYLRPLGQVVLLNGSDTDAGSWWWDGKRWARAVPPIPAPSPRRLSGVAVAGGGGEVVLYGGIGLTGPSSETWTYDGRGWRQHAVTAPTATDHVAMAHDPVREQTVLFGGRGRDGSARGETWVWDGRAWTLVAEDGPAARIHHTMAWDPVTRRILMVGGQQASDMWAWDGRAWSRLDQPAGRAPRLLAGRMAYVEALGRVVLTGGASADGALSQQTWLWDGRRWEQLTTPSPPGRIGHAVAYDVERAALVLYGGFAHEEQLTDVWELRGGRWSQVLP